MSKNNRLYRHFPIEVIAALRVSKGWVVGSAVKKILHGKGASVNDYDILVEDPMAFQQAIKALEANKLQQYYINSLGGLKFDFGEFEIDIWCESLDHYLTSTSKFEYLYNMSSNVLLRTQEPLVMPIITNEQTDLEEDLKQLMDDEGIEPAHPAAETIMEKRLREIYFKHFPPMSKFKVNQDLNQ